MSACIALYLGIRRAGTEGGCSSLQFLRFSIAQLHDSASAEGGVEIFQALLQGFCLR